MSRATDQTADQVKISLPLEKVASLCRQFGVEELSLFGSVLREDFRSDSDVDFLAIFHNDDYGPWAGKLTDFEEQLGALIGRKADVIPKKNLKWAIRDRVLGEARTIYAAN